MRFLYTETPDKWCNEVKPGVWGRPCHTSEIPKLKKSGWSEKMPDSVESIHGDAEALMIDVVKAYELKFGKKPHHKMKLETIIEALENDEGRTSEQDINSDGDQHPDE